MKMMKKMIAVLIIACTMLSLTACQDTTWAYDYNGKKIPSGLYIAFTMDAYSQAMYHKDIKSDIKNLMKQTLDKKPAKQWIIDSAKATADRYVAIDNQFEVLGLKLTESDQKMIKKSTDDKWEQVGKYYEPNGVSKETMNLVSINQQKESVIFEKYYGKGGIEEVSNANLLIHFKENFASVNMLKIPLETGDKLTDEQKTNNKTLKAKADEYAKLINEQGKSYNEVQDAFIHYKAGSKHNPNAKDDVILKDEDTKQYIKKDSKVPSEKVVKAVFNDLKPDGKAVVIPDEDAYYVAIRYDVTKDPSQFDKMRESILFDVKGEDFKKLVDKWKEPLKPTANNASINRYDPKKIKLK
ncbi:hypothetical protein RBG61_08735 [Paludicola sp. MB14-C6]|uniref:hypothetical protein n=1 Tax=Paludihabitans sp. MB14-C6 TaxID=3070656 RepID=UPI0027DC6381|nr:hypothetical protein [Paludicola sp. MB14-C6]WMJ22085.1 hypothetical protein RBG61_08735 [Paludicola sp. MB14-C6]